MSGISGSALAALRDRSWRVPFDFWNAPVVGVTPGTRAPAGVVGAQKMLGFARYISTGLATNGVYEIAENALIYPGAIIDPFGAPFVFSMTLNRSTGVPGPAGECFQGIGVGDFGQLTPWQTTFAASISGSVVQMRWNFVTSQWEILVWDGDTGTAPLVQVCTVQKPFTIDTVMPQITIAWTPPTGGVNSRLDFYWENVLVHSLVNNARANTLRANSSDNLWNFFVTNGTGAATAHSEAGFYIPRVFAPVKMFS